jgi:hypothetical protein
MANGLLKTVTLPQYMFSQEIGDRFRAATLEETSRLERAGLASDSEANDVTTSETTADAFDYFIRNRDELADEFLDDLVESVGEPQAERFVNAVSNGWYFNPTSPL